MSTRLAEPRVFYLAQTLNFDLSVTCVELGEKVIVVVKLELAIFHMAVLVQAQPMSMVSACMFLTSANHEYGICMYVPDQHNP